MLAHKKVIKFAIRFWVGRHELYWANEWTAIRSESRSPDDLDRIKIKNPLIDLALKFFYLVLCFNPPVIFSAPGLFLFICLVP